MTRGSTFKFAVHPVEKTPLLSSVVWETGHDSLLRLLRTPKTKEKK